MSWEDLSVRIAGMALFIAAARNEAMPAKGCFWKWGWACRYVV